ncbi:PAS domain-containing protein [Noviherbaspirillum humi]|uniref:PAS domain-containing protein n=1 Tax=Noviherbaspirillum humi TaxID=1688639 RepID=UPI00159561A4|nr:PAS domain-containing protein [Noviherbaspirillum humi]
MAETFRIASAYAALAWLSELLAVPPDLVIAFFPAAGFALGLTLIRGWRCLPGIGLGWLVFITWHIYQRTGTFGPEHFLPAGITALGAMLQAALGAWLIKRYGEYPSPLDKPRTLLQFLFLAAPASCLTGASIGMLALAPAGLIPMEKLADYGFNWWLGDTLGVLVTLPLVLIWQGQPARLWRARRYTVGLPLLVSISVVVTGFVIVREVEQEYRFGQFEDDALSIAQTMQTALNLRGEMLHGMANFISSAPEVSEAQFRANAGRLMERYSALHRVVWAPGAGTGGSQRGKAGAGRLRMPVQYAQAPDGPVHETGTDLAAIPELRWLIEEARDSGELSAGAPLRLQSEKGNRLALQLIIPVTRGGVDGGSVAERRRAFLGALVATFDIDTLVRNAVGLDKRRRVQFSLTESSPAGSMALLYRSSESNLPRTWAAVNTSFDFGGKTYLFSAVPAEEFGGGQLSWRSWWALSGGMFFAAMMAMYLLQISGHSYNVEREVAHRTRELDASRDQLRTSLGMLRVLVEGSSTFLCVRDTKSRFLYVNREYADMIGWDKEDLIGRSLEEVFGAESAGRDIATDREVLQGAANVREEIELQAANFPGLRTFMITKSPLFHEDGTLYGVCIVGVDITQEKREKEKQRENMLMLQAVMESTSSAVYVCDPDGNFLYANRRFEMLLNLPSGMLVGRNVRSIFSEAVAQEYLDHFHRVCSEGFSISEEVLHHDQTRPLIHLFVRSALRNESGVVYGICGVGTDITRFRRAEEALHELNHQLVATSALQLAILNSTNFAIFSVDMTGTLRAFNVGAQRMLGYSEEEMVGVQSPVVLHDPDEIMLRAQQLSGELDMHVRPGIDVFFAKPGRSLVDEHEWTFIRKDGSRLPVMMSVSALRNEALEMVGYVAVAYDLTERKKIERMKDEFISTVSHELRTPLTSIRGSLGLMVGGMAGELSARAVSLLSIARNNCDRLTRLINDVLDAERIRSGHMNFHMLTCDLRALVEQAITATQPYAQQYQVEFEFEPPDDDIIAKVDSDRILQVMVNLLGNAAKFSTPDSTVRATLSRSEAGIRFAVIDHGCGIPEEFRDRIFQRFARADASATQQKGGTGLGLSISKSIIERHYGHIGFYSEPGVETEFYFELPLAPVELALLPQPSPALMNPAGDGAAAASPAAPVAGALDQPPAAPHVTEAEA